MKTELERPREDGRAWEKFIEPESPDVPLIRVRENREQGFFEAVFALELSGVIRKESIREYLDSDEKQNADSELRCSSLLAGIYEGQGLDFVYTGGKNYKGQEFFDWKIVGHSKGIFAEEAADRAKQLYQGLSVFLGSMGKDYCFMPVDKAEKMNEVKIEGKWMAEIQPSGIAIKGNRQRKIGFTAKNEPDSVRGTVIIPFSANGKINSFDSIVTGSVRCPAPVTLKLSVKPFVLSEDDLQAIGHSVEWLQNGEAKRIKYNDEPKNGVEESAILNGLKRNLMLWLKNPAGLKITCTAISEKPIPFTHLRMVGNQLFQGAPISIKTNKETPSEDSGDKVLDLCGYINGESAMLPLFPGIKALINCGTKRVYTQPALKLPGTGILMGRTGDDRDVRFAGNDRSRHCYIIGATGTGKSTLLYNMITQDIRNGEGVAVIDPHGDLYHQVLRSVPKSRIDDIVLIDPCDFDYAVGINFLECGGAYKHVQINFIVNEMIKIFNRLYTYNLDAMGPVFEQYMRNAMFLIMDNEVHKPTLMDIPLIFEDKDFRSFLLSKCKNAVVEDFWTKQAEEVRGEGSLKSIAPYITSKLNQFTSNALIRPIIGQHRSTINFREIMDSRKILLVNLSKGLLGELDTQLLGMLIIGKIFTAVMGRVKSRVEHRSPMFLYVDEFQNFTTDTVAYLLSEARKFGLHLTLANQNLAQLSENSGKQNILDAVLGNVGTILLFRLGALDAGRMDIYTRPELQAQDLQEMPDFHAAGKLMVNNAPSKPFVFKTMPLMETEDAVDINLAMSNSLRKYAAPTKEVEEDIMARRVGYKYSAEPSE